MGKTLLKNEVAKTQKPGSNPAFGKALLSGQIGTKATTDEALASSHVLFWQGLNTQVIDDILNIVGFPSDTLGDSDLAVVIYHTG